MTADGNWNLVVSTPMGERRATLSLKADGGTLTGSQMADGSTAEIFDGTVNGNQLSWKVSISDPMPLTLQFNGTVDGDEVTGSVMLGNVGSSPSLGLAVKCASPASGATGARCSKLANCWLRFTAGSLRAGEEPHAASGRSAAC